MTDSTAPQPRTADRAPAALVVDDSATMRMYHRQILDGAGFTVSEASNGYEALELALAQRFDLLVVDINMPVMDGYTLVESVRRESVDREVPVIMISTESEPADADEAYHRGADLYLVKPADPEYLKRVALALASPDRPKRARSRR